MSVMTETITWQVSGLNGPWKLRTREGPFRILTTCPSLAASLSTDRCAYHLRILRRGSARHLGQTGVDNPIQDIMIGIRLWQSGQNGHTTIEWRELKKALHELADKGQINLEALLSFAENRSPHSPSRGMKNVRQKSWPLLLEAMQKAQLRGAQQVLTTKQGSHITVPTMVFGGKEAPRFASPHNDPLGVEMKIASEIVRQILIDTESSVDIITWDCLKKLTHQGHDIVPLVHPMLGFGGQEVNPTGMIHLPILFGDKLKAKNLEVDFLLIGVPTAYNVILGCLTLHKPLKIKRKEKKKKEKERGYTLGSPLSSRPSPSEAPASASKGLVASSPAPSPSLKGGINSTSSGSRAHPRPVGGHRCSGGRPRSSYPPEILWPASPRPCANTLSLRHSATALTPRANTSTFVTSSSVILVGSEVPEVAKSQDLTRISETLTAGSALMKLFALGDRGQSLADRLPECRGLDWSTPASPAWVGADAAVSSRRLARTGKLIVGFFPHGTRGGTCSQNNSSVYPKLRVTMKGGKQGSRVYLLGLLFHKALSLLFPTTLGLGCHLLRNGVPSLKDRQPRPRLLCIKKGSQEQPIPLEKFLRIRRPAAARKKSFSKNFNLGSQFKGSLALQRFYCLSHKFGDESGPIGLPCVELKVAGCLPLFNRGQEHFPNLTPSGQRGSHISNTLPLTSSQRPHNLCECQFILVQNLFDYRVKRKYETSCAINYYTFGGWLVHSRICLGDYESAPCRQERIVAPGNSGPSATILRTSPIRERPFLLSIDFLGVEGPSWDEELVEAPSKDECFNNLSEEEEDVPLEVELVLVEASSTSGLDELGVEQGLPCVPSANNLFGDPMRGVDLFFAILRT
ncbi:LOW QUALITY PROTEIN: hypothetical protein Cgig2_000045 [Carnegiea gigantea]|uniref:Uncharacterized protein n=1 Tax=Carnegiea gigantea TaxID=171969 RepID=A0A9Q1KX45_9CARY|nr:LOW QUALITY PROTEIN: hypothetical protein Cgig2_000045 [Carnegiea gigantea]